MSSPKNFSVDVQTVDDVFAPSIMSPCASSLWNLLTPKSNRAPGLPPASPKRNRPIDFDEDEDELRRPPSLYVHNPYGPGAMLRLKPFHEIVAELQAQAAAAAAILQAEQAANSNVISNTSNIVKAPEVEVEKTEDNEDEDDHSQDESGSPLTCPSSNNKQSANGKRRRRQKKPRKNRSANLESDSGERVSVCLDYLKGVCNRKRSRCKFAHPPLAFTTAVPTTRVPCACTPLPNTVCECPTPQVNIIGLIPTIPVCAGWAMMGHCSNGPMCAEAHPQANVSYQPVGAPVYPSSWMGMDVSRAARRASNVSAGSMWSDSSEEGYYRTPSPSSFEVMPTNHLQYPQHPQPVAAFPSTFLRAWREVNAWLGATAFQNFDYTLAHVFNVLYEPASGVTLERLLPAIFGKAIDNCERLARVLAALCERLCSLLSEEEQEQMKMQMSRLATTVLQFVPEGTKTDELIIGMARKQRGTAAFLGELFLQGLITPACLQSHLEYITQRAMEPSDVGALYTELGCVILNVAGHVASSRLSFDQIVQSLNGAVSFHQAHRQGMAAGTMNVQSSVRML